MALMCFLQTSLKLVGTTYKIEASATRQAHHKANTILNTCTITICIRKSMSFQEKQEAKKVLPTVNSCQSVSFHEVSERSLLIITRTAII